LNEYALRTLVLRSVLFDAAHSFALALEDMIDTGYLLEDEVRHWW
jgi:hypothetical protein